MEFHGSRPRAPSAVCPTGAFSGSVLGMLGELHSHPGASGFVSETARRRVQMKKATFGFQVTAIYNLDHQQCPGGAWKSQHPACQVCLLTDRPHLKQCYVPF